MFSSDLDRNIFADQALQKLLVLFHNIVQVDRPHFHLLLAAESQ